jgi:hypothetical protein
VEGCRFEDRADRLARCPRSRFGLREEFVGGGIPPSSPIAHKIELNSFKYLPDMRKPGSVLVAFSSAFSGP